MKEKHFLHRPHCVVKSSSDKWHALTPEQPTDSQDRTPDYWLAKITAYAEAVMTKEIQNYQEASKKNLSKDSERGWLETVLRSGALGDKISAYSVLLQVRTGTVSYTHLTLPTTPYV